MHGITSMPATPFSATNLNGIANSIGISFSHATTSTSPATSTPVTENYFRVQKASKSTDRVHATRLTEESNSLSSDPTLFNSTSSFRNVSACHRCRMRKHRCDQNLPQCQSCEKAKVKCVGYDPITKQEIPRSYVYFLESRVSYLSQKLLEHKIDFKPAFACDSMKSSEKSSFLMNSAPSPPIGSPEHDDKPFEPMDNSINNADLEKKLSSEVHGMLSSSDMKIDALRKDGRDDCITSKGNSIHSSLLGITTCSTTIDASFLGLPDRQMASQLVHEYFNRTNLHLPVLHRPDFEDILERIYSTEISKCPKKELFFVYIVFAIGATTKLKSSGDTNRTFQSSGRCSEPLEHNSRKRTRSSSQFQNAEEYHNLAMACLEPCLGLLGQMGMMGHLQSLQAVVLLCSFSLCRPTSPRLASLLDVAVGIASDLRLYLENDASPELVDSGLGNFSKEFCDDWVGDLRRRLWWCVYSLDRLIAPYVQRPLSVPDDVITTRFPSITEDIFITRHGTFECVGHRSGHKFAAQHRFKLRILQSEMHDVFQYQHALMNAGPRNRSSDRKMPTPLQRFPSFRSWRKNMHSKLETWKLSMPSSTLHSERILMELDFWQSIIALYRWSVQVPPDLVHILAINDETSHQALEDGLEEVDWICMQVAEASSNALHLHRMMQNLGCHTSPYITAHEIFLSGSLLFFTIWNSQLVRQKLTPRSLDYSSLAAINRLSTLQYECSFARKSITSLKAMATVTMRMKLSTVSSMTPCGPSTGLMTSKQTPKALFPKRRNADMQNQFNYKFQETDGVESPISPDILLPRIPESECSGIVHATEESNTIFGRQSTNTDETCKAPGLHDPKSIVKFTSTSPNIPNDTASLFADTLPTPESLDSWDTASTTQTISKLISSDDQYPMGGSSTINDLLQFSGDNPSIQSDQDLLDAYIVGLT